MQTGYVQIIYGAGKGKTAMALGKGLSVVAAGKTAVLIQFLQGGLDAEQMAAYNRLEPELQVFRFEKSAESFSKLSEEAKARELMNIQNGLNFAKKVMATGECDMLILDGVLGLVDQKIVPLEDIQKLLSAREETMNLVLTGTVLPEELKEQADSIIRLESVK